MSDKELELSLLFEGLYRKYKYDFREYRPESALRRVENRLVLENLENIAQLQHLIIHDKAIANRLLKDLSINYTLMFRNPHFFKIFRSLVVPKIKDREHIKIWHAGCSTGEEVYSMAILLEEEGLLSKCRLYATDFNHAVIEKAKAGIFPLKGMANNVRNYQQSGGTVDFADYYRVKFDHVIMNNDLKKSITFAYHNLTEDPAFGEMDIIICRNVFIYFSNSLKNRVFELFNAALLPDGIFCCGQKDYVSGLSSIRYYKSLCEHARIFQKTNETIQLTPDSLHNCVESAH